MLSLLTIVGTCIACSLTFSMEVVSCCALMLLQVFALDIICTLILFMHFLA